MLLGAPLACGGDDGADDGNADQTSDPTQSSSDGTSPTSTSNSSATDGTSATTPGTSSDDGTTLSESSGGSSGIDTGSTTHDDTGGIDVPCGDALVCTGGDVCIEDVIAPECTNLDEGEMCARGQKMTQCGGAGIPCCCEPQPPSEFRCVSPTDCPGVVDCACLGPICTDDRQCIAQGADPEHLFVCEAPAQP